MAVTADRVVVELEARLGQYEANVARAEQKFDRSMASIQKSAGATEKFVGTAMRGMVAALAGVSVIALTRQFLSLADEAKKLDATLKLATAGFGSFGQAQKDVRAIANETRAGLSETAKLYANFVRGAKELGGTQAQAARATETFSKTLKISGADANQAASATLQFGQALAAGALRGDELNSILEASPRLARLLAESMGRPIGEIKKLGEEGLLTSDKLLKALTDVKFTEGIDSEFKQLPLTFEDAMTRVSNASLITFAAFDRGGQFSSMLANFVGDGADGFVDLETAAENFGISTRGVIEGLGDAFQPLLDGGREVLDLLGIDFKNFALAARSDIEQVLGFADQLLNIGPGIANKFGANGRFDSRLLENFRAGAAKSDAEQRLRLIMQGDPLADVGGFQRPSATKPAAAPSSGKKKGGGTKKSPLDPEAFAREEASLNDQILRLKGGEVDSATESARIEIERIEVAKKAAIASIGNDKRYTDAQKSQIVALTETVAAMEVAKVIKERDADLAKQASERQRVNERYEMDALHAQADIAKTREARLEAERRILDHLEDQEQKELETLIAAGKVADATKARADLAAAQAGRRRGVEDDLSSPLSRYADRFSRESAADQVENYVIDELEAVQDSITSAVTKKLGVKDPFLSGLIEMFIQQQLIRPIAEALAGVGGGGMGGGIIGAVGGILGFASGGSMSIGGRGGTDRNTLSLNGRPIANVSRGETLSVGSKALSGRSGAAVVQPIIQVDARGAVMNDQFAQMILAQANQGAIQAAAAMGQQVNQNVPARLAKFNKDGT
ncbi:hypothetical protein GCM10007897_41440 [Sphingobium jiangsuense]|uniref:Tape measure domain-containing protein n=1 Tax=Sphingobium jiangsuense TaxID=870476 RepID=A0A7W6BU03_9SPHN|nr:tape measure protein [Sphingobium jiangsuense]MBB3927819.1 tape measure domain-containing protein [Sphingobium jiangsuense]GLT02722.1 hypothetical protein GCM10007897_41440 [Sphingobium jiangsuense]